MNRGRRFAVFVACYYLNSPPPGGSCRNCGVFVHVDNGDPQESSRTLQYRNIRQQMRLLCISNKKESANRVRPG